MAYEVWYKGKYYNTFKSYSKAIKLRDELTRQGLGQAQVIEVYK